MVKFVAILLLVKCFLCTTTIAEKSPKVKVVQGALAGTTVLTRGGREVFAFLGVPYAAPPTGQLRFKSPQPAPEWDGVRDASKEGSICLQQYVLIEKFRNITAGNEDCLYLNVFSPKLSHDAQLPVMFFIHGGGFGGGSGSMDNYGPELLLDKDVVLVSINYRLGPLGFLSTGDSVLPGNLGLKDQRAALRWVQENILQFGGNKNSVTIFGESAGGASVHFQLLSPQSKGLFHRGISQSGTAMCPWAFSSAERHRHFAENLAKIVGCPYNNASEAFISCLMLLPADTIVSSVKHMIEWDMEPVVQFNPVVEPEGVEDAVFTQDPWTLTSDVPWMVGINQDEGSLKIISLTQGDVAGKFKQINERFNYILPMSLLYQYTAKNPDQVSDAIKEYYLGDEGSFTLEMIAEIRKLYTDAWFTAGTLEAVRRHNGPLFVYYLTYNNSFSLCSEYYDSPQNAGVCHFDELLYIFPMEGHAPRLMEGNPDYIMSLKMIQLWTNFAKNKTPRLDNQEFWHSSNGSSRDYLLISNEGLMLHQHLLAERDHFWQSLPYREKPLVPHRKSFFSDEL